MNISQLNEWFSSSFKLNEVEIDKLGSQLEHLFYRLNMMEKLQLSYLSLNRLASALSSGELQRVRLSSILGNKLHRGCYILDEPTAGLDVGARNEILELLREYMAKDEERTILITSHIATDLESLCDDIYLIDCGKVILHQDISTIMDEYAVIKVDNETYEKLDKEYIIKTQNETFGKVC